MLLLVSTNELSQLFCDCAGDIVAIGDGKVGSTVQEFHLKPGQTVLYSKFGIGVTDLLVQGEQHCLIKEEDCIGVLPKSGATADDIPKLQPNGDRVLLKVLPVQMQMPMPMNNECLLPKYCKPCELK